MTPASLSRRSLILFAPLALLTACAPATPPPPSGAAPAPQAPHTLIGAQALNDFTSAKPPEVEK